VNRNSRTMIKVRAASQHVTWFLGQRCPTIAPLTFVVGYPKSGTTWAAQLVSDYLRLPFPRFSLLPIAFPAVVHGHSTVSPRMPRCVYSMRDGRDVMVSLYFYMARNIPEGTNPRVPRHLARWFPGLKDKADVRANLPRFLETEAARPSVRGAGWADHVRSYLRAVGPDPIGRRGLVMLRYEDLLADGPATLARAMSLLTGEDTDEQAAREAVDRFSFSRLTRQKREGERARFLRKGGSGDWRNHFTPESAQIFRDRFGDALIEAGYEPDHAWVGSVA